MNIAISMFSSNTNRNTNQIPVQISAKEVSTRLQLTERTILNFIKQRYQIKDFIESKETEVTVETAEISRNSNGEKNKVKSKESKMSLTSLRVFEHISCCML